ncbi:MAG: DUF1540 domain-containing protein [Clostridia bacterium]|nr:DUF1540 domain-containing protein [Clostridia bacterium]
MIKCNATICVHNKENVCNLENIQITSIYMCDNCKFAPNPDAFLGFSEDERAYHKRKNMLIF